MATKEILPLDTQLVDKLRIAKENHEAASQALTDAQFAIFEAVKDRLPSKGTTSFTGVKIATGFHDKWDQDLLQEIQKGWTANLKFPFRVELKAVASDLKYVKENAPSAYESLEKALTLTEKKPTFELVDIK